MLRSLTFRTTLIALACAASFSANAIADGPKAIDVPEGDLTGALEKLAEQSGAEFIYSADQVKGFHTPGLHGEYEAKEAIRLLIKGTGLEVRTEADGAILIALPKAAPANPTSDRSSPDHTKEGKRSSSDSFRTAQVDQGTNSQAAAIGNNAADSQQQGVKLEEIVVTAQKRAELLQDVPVPVTAISAQTLLSTNQLRLQDYYSSIPGLGITPADDGSAQLSIRGITTGGYSNPVVGVTIDDVPFGSSSANGFGNEVPDIDPSDLARIEVLRGPQGTLYGASSLGGLVKFVTLDPSTSELNGQLQAGSSSVYNGGNLGYSVRGSINVPLGDTVAVRASAFFRHDPGYIDNVQTGERAVNRSNAKGGLLTALWRPSDDLSLKVNALVQGSVMHGSPLVYLESGLGDLQQDALRRTGGVTKNIQSYTATLKARLGGLDLTWITGYGINHLEDDPDFTEGFGPYTQRQFGTPGTSVPTTLNTSKFTQEVRVSIPVGERLEWMVGGFYNHESSNELEPIYANDTATGAVVGTWLQNWDPFTFSELAGFTDLTVHFTDRFDIQVGGRESQTKQAYSQTFVGAYDDFFLGVPSPLFYPTAHSKDNAFTYLFTPRFKVTSDLMVYARLASGYQPGGPNIGAAGLGVPTTFGPDRAKNYEVGAKGDFLDHRLAFDASVYYIDWSSIQLTLFSQTAHISYQANGGAAKSEGVEFSVNTRPLDGLTVGGWVAFNDAVLTENFPFTATVAGESGDRLPYGSRWSGHVSAEEEFPLIANVRGFVGGDWSYAGKRKGVFLAEPPRQVLSSYSKTDLRAGIRYESWTFNLYVNNLADKRGVLSGGLGTFIPNAFNYIQPRTVGVNAVKKF